MNGPIVDRIERIAAELPPAAQGVLAEVVESLALLAEHELLERWVLAGRKLRAQDPEFFRRQLEAMEIVGGVR